MSLAGNAHALLRPAMCRPLPVYRTGAISLMFALASISCTACAGPIASGAARRSAPQESAPKQTLSEKHPRAATEGSSPAARHFSEARSLLARGSTDEALAAVKQGLALAPRSIEGLNLLGIICDQ